MMNLLIVDDEALVLSALQRALCRRWGKTLRVATETDPLQALERARHETFDVVISDMRMPEVDGVAFLMLISAVQPDCVRIMLTGAADFETAKIAIQDAGVFRYLTKPWDDAELIAHVAAALAQGQALRAQRLSAD